MTELIDYAERAGVENMRERIEVAGVIQREANTLMALLLAGAGAALLFALQSAAVSGLSVAALAVSVYLFVLAGVLNWKCLGLIAYPASHNEPKNLNQPQYGLEQIREWELENLQARILQATTINDLRSRWLNGCRFATTLAPVVAVLAWVLSGRAWADPAAVAQAVVWDCLLGCS